MEPEFLKLTELPETDAVSNGDFFDISQLQNDNSYTSKKISFETIFNAISSLMTSDGKLVFVDPPASPTSEGIIGQVSYSEGYLYICVSSNVWKRIFLLGSW